MSLLRQLIIVIITLFVLLFAGTVFLSAHNTRLFLNEQLRSISQDTATSLGLTLSPHMATGEKIVVESMVNAVFDGGYYREVTITDIKGKPMLVRQAPVRIEGVPDWFVQMFPLETPRGEALIMAGWQQAGTVAVAANPGIAYATMWRNSVQAFWWFLAASVFTFGIGVVSLHFVLRPLQAVEQQAKAICDREYPVQNRIPWTLELRSVVEAMNRMTRKVKEMFAEQAEAMERIRKEAYLDAVSGLPNRRYFDMQLKSLVEAEDHFGEGALIFLELKDIKQLNEARGYQAVDALMHETGQLLQGLLRSVEAQDSFAARLAGGSFAVVLGDVDQDVARQAGEKLGRMLTNLAERGLVPGTEVGHVGVATYRGQEVGQLLAEADMALRSAQGMGPNAVFMHQTSTIDEFGALNATQWKTLLNEVLEAKRIELHTQPVVATNGRVLHNEVLLRIRDAEGRLIPAGLFVPMAKRLGLMQAFDRHVVDAGIAGLIAEPDNAIAINLFPASVHTPAFVDWLCARLAEQPGAARRMLFEVTEHGGVEHLDTLREWVRRVGELGAQTGLDHFGKGFASFGYLSTLKLHYLKVDGSFVRGIDQNRDNQFFIDSLTKIAHGLDLTVIAESVEADVERKALESMRVDGVQGFGIGRPAHWR